MTTPRTRPLPGTVLVAVPTTAWVTLICVVWVLAATDQDAPFGGFFSLGIAVAITTTLISLGLWALNGAKAHVSTEVGRLIRRLDWYEQPTQPLLTVVGTAAVTRPDDELPGYAKGYADGLSRRPMEPDAKVIPIESGKAN